MVNIALKKLYSLNYRQFWIICYTLVTYRYGINCVDGNKISAHGDGVVLILTQKKNSVKLFLAITEI